MPKSPRKARKPPGSDSANLALFPAAPEPGPNAGGAARQGVAPPAPAAPVTGRRKVVLTLSLRGGTLERLMAHAIRRHKKLEGLIEEILEAEAARKA